VDLAAVLIVLRFVSAADVGAASATWTITTLLEPFASFGVSYALVTIRRLDRRTLDTAMWLAWLSGSVLAALIALTSGTLAAIFAADDIAPLIAAGGLKLIPIAAAAVLQQRLARALRHRELAAASACATLVSALARVAMAVAGLGAWCFVLSTHVYALTLLISLYVISPLRPRAVFSRSAARTLIELGLPTSASTSVALMARNLDMLFVSRWFGLEALGLYRVAFDLAMGPLLAVGDVIARSAAPTLRRLLREPRQLKATFMYAIRLALIVSIPIAVFTAALAPVLLSLAKDPSFAAAAPAARVLVPAAVLLVIFGLFSPLAQALGHPELGLWSNLELFVLLATSLWLCLSLFGPFLSIGAAAVAWCMALCAALLLTQHRFRRAVRSYYPVRRSAPRSSVIPRPSY
jgi:O-antigen/teichoic acid export membrane protein